MGSLIVGTTSVRTRADLDLTGHDLQTLLRWKKSFNLFEWPIDFPVPEPAEGATMTDKQKYAHSSYRYAWDRVNAAIGAADLAADRLIKIWVTKWMVVIDASHLTGSLNAILEQGPAAGLELEIGTKFDHLAVEIAPAPPTRYDRTDRRDARGYIVYEWAGAATVEEMMKTEPEPTTGGSWRDRPPLL